MADISTYINTIKGSQPGEIVRDAIIAAVQLINEAGGASGSLGGKDASYYATFDEFADLLDKASQNLKTTSILTDVKPDADKLVTSGILYDDLEILDNALKAILNLEIQPPADEGAGKALIRIEHQLAKIQRVRNEISDALEGKKSAIEKTGNTTFRDYAEIIERFITNDNVIIDDTYEAKSDGKVKASRGHAWVEVDAREYEFKTTTKSFSKNDANVKPGSNYIGFSEVSVNVTTRTGGASISSARATGKGNTGIDEDGMMDMKVITENTGAEGITPAEDGAVGWRHISVQVTEPEWDPEATFNVQFYNGEEKIGEDTNIPFDGFASYDGETPESGVEGEYFSGWDPSPRKIRYNTICYAQFSDVPPSSDEIQASWDEIANCAGSEYPIGSWKNLTLQNCDYVYNSSGDFVTIPFSQSPIRMRKVATGEDGTTSTWLAMDGVLPLRSQDTTSVGQWRSLFGGRSWSDSFARKFLNGEFLSQAIPETIRLSLQPVTKYTRANRGGLAFEEKTIDTIWIPSIRELFNKPNAQTQKLAYQAFAACSEVQRLTQGSTPYYRFVNMEHGGLFYGQIFESASSDCTTDPAIHDSFERGREWIVPPTPSKYIAQSHSGSGAAQNYFLRSVSRPLDYATSYGYYINTNGTVNDPQSHDDTLNISDTTTWATSMCYLIGFCM